MRIFFHIVQGDPLDNGSGGRVVQGCPSMSIAGPDQCMRHQAFIGHQAWCGVCRSVGKIVAGPGTPGPSRRLYDATIQACEAVEGDIVLCRCAAAPKLVAIYGRCSYIMDDSDNRVVSAAKAEIVPTAFEVPLSTQPPAPVSSPASRSDANKAIERRCTLHIGVFFDGTGNNAINTALFDQCRASRGSALNQSPQDMQSIAAHCKPYMSDTGSSYEGGYTNVWRLYQLYRNSRDKPFDELISKYFIRIYVDGIGTTAGKPDSPIPGYIFGTGDTGMIERVRYTIAKDIPKQIQEFAQRHPAYDIEAIEFDVVGFSRGAAAARHFVNEINRKQQGPLVSSLLGMDAGLTDEVRSGRSTRIGFVDLFDTVVSRASLKDGFNVRTGDTGPLHVGLPAGCARQVVQIVARDEHRANFMLTSVEPQHRQIKLPGAHSDIGGGYNQATEGPLMLIEPETSLESADMYYEYKTLKRPPTASKAWQRAEQQRQLWKQRLGDIDDEYLSIDAWVSLDKRYVQYSVVRQPFARVYATLRLQRPIDPSYQLVTLRVMHKVAIDGGVLLDAIDDSDPNYTLPGELTSITQKLLAGLPLDIQEQNLLAVKYLHQSANWNFGRGKYAQSDISFDLLYPNRPEKSDQRIELPNA